MTWRPVVAGSLAAVLVGCGGAAGSRPTGPPGRQERVGSLLTAAPAVVTRACHGAASRGLAVLCPAGWPPTRSVRPPTLRWITLTSGDYLLNAFNGLDDPSPHVFHLLLGGQSRPFGADWTGIDPGLRITTRLVRIPVRGGGSFVQQRPARRIGTTSVHGDPAVLLREPDFPQGGLQGGHVLLLWSQAGNGYVASVHGSGGMTQSALTAIVVALARSVPPQ